MRAYELKYRRLNSASVISNCRSFLAAFALYIPYAVAALAMTWRVSPRIEGRRILVVEAIILQCLRNEDREDVSFM